MIKQKQIDQSRKSFFLNDHFLGDSSQGGTNRLFITATGTGASMGNVAPVENDRPGIARLSTGTTTNNNVIARLSTAINLGNNSYWEFNSTFKINTTLPNSMEDFVIRLGFTNVNSGLTVPTNAVYLSYAGTNTEFLWISFSGGTQSVVTSGVVPAVNTWYDMNISVNPTNVIGTVGGVSKVLSANIPRGLGKEVGVNLSIAKTAGTMTSGQLDVDYYSLYGQLA